MYMMYLNLFCLILQSGNSASSGGLGGASGGHNAPFSSQSISLPQNAGITSQAGGGAAGQLPKTELGAAMTDQELTALLSPQVSYSVDRWIDFIKTSHFLTRSIVQ